MGSRIMPTNLSLASCDLLHTSCCDTMGIYRNMWLLALVKICPTVLEISGQKVYLRPVSVPCDLDLWSADPQSWEFHTLAPQTICANLCWNRFICFLNIVFTSLVTDIMSGRTHGWKDEWTTQEHNAFISYSSTKQTETAQYTEHIQNRNSYRTTNDNLLLVSKHFHMAWTTK